MGYESRDYFRDGSYTGGSGQWMADAPMCKRIIIATAIVFLFQIFVTRQANEKDLADYYQQFPGVSGADVEVSDPDGLLDGFGQVPPEYRQQMIAEMLPNISVAEEWFALETEKVVRQGQVWRVLTCAFLHSRFGIWHILVNMVLLYYFGRHVELTYGSREFLLIYLVAAVFSSLAYIGIDLLTTPSGQPFQGSAMGASGAVMAILCLFVMWNPGYTIRIWFLFPIEARYLLALYVLFDLHPILLQLAGTRMHTGVAHAGHLGGLLFGFLYYRGNWQLEPIWNRMAGWLPGKSADRKLRQQPKLKEPQVFANSPLNPVPPGGKSSAEAKFDQQVDEILEKISRSGEESLTEQERKILVRGSQRYRQR